MVDARQPKPSKVDRTGSAADAEGERVREAQTQMKNTRTQEKFTFQEGISFQQPCVIHAFLFLLRPHVDYLHRQCMWESNQSPLFLQQYAKANTLDGFHASLTHFPKIRTYQEDLFLGFTGPYSTHIEES